ncbi:PH-like domain-containing protein [Mycobacterium sp. IDR2000157661]|uniref:PH-like domain-containing protein n=1 Tax=Mycobacterium sp. IDR2000157661 TaxID=2867005 RepID=UPI001EEBE114|nr:transporter [Mycobacterium sp. IDR2000157661]ULE32768.1 transporter [Mycobacterium sp. IDR2000157661]
MNTGTLVGSLVMAAVVAVLIAVLIQAMMRGWRRRAERQAQLIGTLPALPDTVGPAIVPATKGLYVGSTLVPHWNDRVAVGDLGFRAKAVLTRYPEGIMLQRSGAGPIWIPDESITAIRTERGIAGKVILGGRSAGGTARAKGRGAPRGEGQPHQGILAIRWQLPSGTEIDTGFRANDRREYSLWVEQEAA